ncbi:SDR family NAD(P)-dependent oxidoreductase [Mycobacterium avium]|uniref:SDR family NAD(P)-dependent oxidoreductase n=1 Tax=Mycobacterium avium TaxID=1764 RepID=UPI001CC5C39D|nr:SDR family NAD(P)-dependent oxidoreductase [Mycobacterium avium]MBZ4521767.1 SDR family NAD(P)-dependent oxidoreductase [Mycobacterium avium subsp. hominissuis]MBZ4531221.1 SDR family NAD(P)-dependent oxidoreductase [Mycobacterium avium subsp. hominissuis]
MLIPDSVAVVTGGASGLGQATVRRLAKAGAQVVIVDLPGSPGQQVADSFGGEVRFAPADVTDTDQVNAALDVAQAIGDIRILVHCAGKGGPIRVVDREGNPGSMEVFERVVRINLFGTFNMLRLSAARMTANPEINGERGVCVLTASVAAWEGQIGQLPYASAKGGIVSMTLVAARDLAGKKIRVAAIAPGLFDTPILPPSARDSLAATIPHPTRLGHPDEFAMLATHIVENPMLNGEVIRLDGALRMAPR